VPLTCDGAVKRETDFGLIILIYGKEGGANENSEIATFKEGRPKMYEMWRCSPRKEAHNPTYCE